MSDGLALLLGAPIGISVLVFIDYLSNRCPKCKTWHFLRSGLIVLDKPSKKKFEMEWVKCKKCGHEWEKAKVLDGVG